RPACDSPGSSTVPSCPRPRSRWSRTRRPAPSPSPTVSRATVPPTRATTRTAGSKLRADVVAVTRTVPRTPDGRDRPGAAVPVGTAAPKCTKKGFMSSVPIAAEQEPDTTVTLLESTSGSGSVRRTVLPGGLRVVTETIPGGRSVSFGISATTGSRDEDSAHAGSAHFLEHLLFKGTN